MSLLFCERKDCVFCEGNNSCILPKNRNLFFRKDGKVHACVNYIKNEQDLSASGKTLLKELRQRYGIL